MRRVEWPEVELILEELVEKHQANEIFILAEYDPDNISGLNVEVEGLRVNLHRADRIIGELKFQTFQRSIGGSETNQ